MKYVIFKMKAGLLIPVIVPQHCTHSQVSVEGGEPISAGFFRFIGNSKLVEVYGESESLKLKPGERDEALLTGVLLSLPMSLFLDL